MKSPKLKSKSRVGFPFARHTFAFGDVSMRNTRKYLALVIAAASFSLSSLASAATSCANQNFDSVTTPALPSGWTSSTSTGSPTSTPFATRGGVGYANTGTNTAFIDDYFDYSDVSLYSPVLGVVPLGSTPTITFSHSFVLWAPDAGSTYQGAFNGGVLEISVNGGPYADITASGGSFSSGAYNTYLDSSFDNPIAQPPLSPGRSVWSGDSGGFRTVTVKMPASANNGTVQLRWRLGTEGGGRSYDTHSGWYVDSLDYSALGDVIFRDGFDGGCPN
jgi:hypothetical protein